MDDTEVLRTAFEARDFAAVVDQIQRTPGFQIKNIQTEGDISMAAFAAFAYYQTNDLDASLMYAFRLIHHLEKHNSERDDDLHESLVAIVCDSLVAKKKLIRAYIFLGSKVRQGTIESEDLTNRLTRLKQQVASKVTVWIGNGASAFVFCLVTTQWIFHPFKQLHYIISATVIAAVAIGTYYFNPHASNLIAKILQTGRRSYKKKSGG